MFDGEIMKKKFTLKKFLDVDNFCPRQSPRLSPKQSLTEFKTDSKTKLYLENVHQEVFFCQKH